MAFDRRLSGILLPLFSLRSPTDAGIGDFGALDQLFGWMQRARQQLLMLLPLLPTAPGDPSPYSTRSAFGLNPLFIDLSRLEGAAFRDDERDQLAQARAADTVQYPLVFALKGAALERAFAHFETKGDRGAFERWQAAAEQEWLSGFALFAALSEAQGHRAWWEWPEGLAKRDPSAIAAASKEHERRVRFHAFLQWVAAMQWRDVRAQAKARGVLLCGDEPFIIAKDSADAWCYPHYLRTDGRLGVPPDDFSATGQDWGLPWFDFEALARDGDRWLKARARHAAATYDVRRIDHAIGYFRQYVRDDQHPHGRFLPGDEPNQRSLGEKNFRLLSDGAGIVAEDLGVIPRFARDTLQHLQLPGYQVMRWSRTDGVYQDPRHYPEVSLVTTGTHDTESVREWWEKAPHWEREAVCRTFPELHSFFPPGASFTPQLHEALLNAALRASSRLCVIPWQDVFAELDRVNVPATMGPHNWSYRMRPSVETLLQREDTARAADWLAGLTQAAGR